MITVPVKINHFSHEKIYIAITEQYPLNREALSNFLNFFRPENTRLTFFYLATAEETTEGIEQILKTEAAYFSGAYQTEYAVYKGKNPFDEIQKVINNQIEELLVVQKGSRLLTDLLFRKFLINKLVHEGETPMVIIP